MGCAELEHNKNKLAAGLPMSTHAAFLFAPRLLVLSLAKDARRSGTCRSTGFSSDATRRSVEVRLRPHRSAERPSPGSGRGAESLRTKVQTCGPHQRSDNPRPTA